MDELEISGRRYLSTRRAAKEHKYTPDYVGQLIRGGKVVGKKVGRSWYVDEQSLNTYLSGETASIKPVVKAVAEIAEPEIKKSEEEKVVIEETPVRTISEEKTFEPVIIKTKNLEEHHIPIRTPAKEKPMGGLRYVVDDEPALPEIQRKQAVSASVPVKHTAEVVQEEREEKYEEYAEVIPHKKIGAFAIAGLVVAGLVTLSATAVISTSLGSRIVVEEGQVASTGYAFQ